MTRWLETDSLSNQDISSALAIGAYTADADRLILVQFFADQVAGNGDYVFYVKVQLGGSGSAYTIIPITTGAAASGVTAIGGQSGMIAVRSGDVVTVYLDGLAGDNANPDTTVRWFELAALQPTTPDRRADVAADGTVGIDWSNVGSPSTSVNLSGTTVKTATDVETDTADIQTRIGTAGAGLTALPWNAAWDAEVQSEAADALDAYDPPTKAELDAAAALLATAANLATLAGYVDTEVAAILAAVDTEVAAIKAKTDNLPADPADQSAMEAAIMAAVGGIPAAPTPEAIHDWLVADTPIPVDVQEWMGDTPLDLVTGKVQAEATAMIDPQDIADALLNAPDGAAEAGSVYQHLSAIQAITGALDVTAVTQVAASSAGHLTVTAGLTFDEAVTGLTIPADWVTALWTLKNNARDTDTAALVQLRATNPAAGGDGLQRLNGAALVAPITAADGDLTVTQASGRIDVRMSDEMTAQLGAATAIGWDVKFIDDAGDSSGRRGTADVVLTETKATA